MGKKSNRHAGTRSSPRLTQTHVARLTSLPTDNLPYSLHEEAKLRYKLRTQSMTGIDMATVDELFTLLSFVVGVSPAPVYGFERIVLNKSVEEWLEQNLHLPVYQKFWPIWEWAQRAGKFRTGALLADVYLDWLYTEQP